MVIRELTIKDGDELALQAISLVESPAIEVDFITLSKIKEKKFVFTKNVVGDKQMLYGPALIPNKLILRIDEETDEYFQVYFSQETVEKCSKSYMTTAFNKFTIDHTSSISDAKLIENWIIEDPLNDKSSVLGFNLPRGTWFVGIKIENEILWNKIKNGEFKGFSIEAFFTQSLMKHSLLKEINEEDFFKSQLEEIYNTSKNDDEAKLKLQTLYNNFKK